MKVGDLVRITRASIGTPKGTVALILDVKHMDGFDAVELLLQNRRQRRGCRRLASDLEVISESR